MKRKTVWSLAGEVDVATIEAEGRFFEEEMEKLLRHPKTFSQTIFLYPPIKLLLYLLSIVFIALGIFFPPLFYFGIVMLVSYYFSAKRYYNRQVSDVVKYEIAKQNGWLYEPEQNRKQWNGLSVLIPEIFQKGSKGQFVDDQFYGSFQMGSRKVNFHTGLLHYTIGSRENQQEYADHFFGFQLSKELHSRFFLYPEDFESKLVNSINGTEIEVESSEFNRMFAFAYNGKKHEREQDILKILTPNIQLRLLDIVQEKGLVYEVLFANDFVVFLFRGKLVKKYYTDLTKHSSVNPVDTENVKNELFRLIRLVLPIAKKLD